MPCSQLCSCPVHVTPASWSPKLPNQLLEHMGGVAPRIPPTPHSSVSALQRALLPKFLIRGHLSSTNCVITQPLTGELVVESSEAAVRSVELQLVRVETCGEPQGWTQGTSVAPRTSAPTEPAACAPLLPRLCRGLLPRRHRNPEHPDR